MVGSYLCPKFDINLLDCSIHVDNTFYGRTNKNETKGRGAGTFNEWLWLWNNVVVFNMIDEIIPEAFSPCDPVEA